jgi:F0F1-type ATP synthase assembly protein I
MSEPDDADKGPLADLPGLVGFAVMGSTIAVCEAVGVVLGLWVDHLWRVSPFGLVIGIVLGTAAAIASVITQIRRYL